MFWVTTKGRSDWPVLVNDSTWPGTMLFSIFRAASAARIFSGSSEPALEMAVSKARVVSYAMAWYHCGSTPVAALYRVLNSLT